MHDMNGIANISSGPQEIVTRPEVVEIFAEVFQFTGELHIDTSRKTVARWDSLQHVALVVALEDAFGISLSMDEMVEITCVGDINTILARHGV